MKNKKTYIAPSMKIVDIFTSDEINNFFNISGDNTTIFDIGFGGFWNDED